jgi:hypothetical protein
VKQVACPACGVEVDRLRQGALMNRGPASNPFHLMTCPGAPVTTTTADLFTQAAPQGDMDAIKRDRWGRPLITPPDGGPAVAYQRVTTFIKSVESSFGLEQWKLRQAVVGLMARPDLCKAVQAHGPGYLDGDAEDKKTLDAIVKQALDAAASSGKATIGTALHRITERHDRGQLDPATVPEWAVADLEAYKRATDGIEWLAIERMTVQDELRVAGTPDRIGRGPDGVVRIYDLKTGSYWPSSHATQLGVYANSSLYDIRTGERSEHGADVECGVVIHLPAGTGEATLRRVDIAAGWECARTVAPAVAAWQKRKDLDLGEVERPVDLLGSLIAAAPTADRLAALWREHRADWTPAHTALAAQRKAELGT